MCVGGGGGDIKEEMRDCHFYLLPNPETTNDRAAASHFATGSRRGLTPGGRLNFNLTQDYN